MIKSGVCNKLDPESQEEKIRRDLIKLMQRG